MKKITLGILAHVDAGKTTLAEALLYNTQMIKTLGRVDKKTAVLDTEALEKKRGITIYAKEAYYQYQGNEYYLIDTPGHQDFITEMEAALSVLDVAILIISANDLLQSHTQTIWQLLKKHQLPVIIFINKMDIANCQQQEILDTLKKHYSENCLNYNDKNNLLENISLTDEKLLNTYLATNDISLKQIQKAFKNRQFFPCLFGSALKNVGIANLLAAIDDLSQMPVYSERFSARVFKISRDDKNQRLVHLKVTGGILHVKDLVTSFDKQNLKWQAKVNEIRVYNGVKYVNYQYVKQGSVIVVTGLNEACVFDQIGDNQNTFTSSLKPLYRYQIKLLSPIGPLKFLKQIQALIEEQPQLNIHWNKNTQALELSIMGKMQLEILKDTIWQRFKIAIAFEYTSIIYKETISKTIEGVGHFEPLGHYAEVHLCLEPLKPQSGILVSSNLSKQQLDLSWQKAILTTLSLEVTGVVTNSLLTVLKIALVNVKVKQDHSSRLDFIEASKRALRQGLMQAASQLLEPYYKFVLKVLNQYSSKVLFDLNKRYVQEIKVEVINEHTIITGMAPVVCLNDYQQEVINYTNATALLTLEFAGYNICHNSQEVIFKFAYNPLKDEANPAGSIFIHQSVVTYINWDEVYDYMDLPLQTKKSAVLKPVKLKKVFHNTISQKEIKSIMQKTYYANSQNKLTAKPFIKPTIQSNNKQEPIKKPYLIIDGYNVIFSWDDLKVLANDDLDAAREKLIARISNYQAYRNIPTMLVFDAYKVSNHQAEVITKNNIMIVYTKQKETADTFIEKFAHDEKAQYQIQVVTSDNLEQIVTRANGAMIISSLQFEQEVLRIERQIQTHYQKKG